VRGDAGVGRAVPRACHDIDAGLEVGVHGAEARAAMDPGKANEARASLASDEDWVGLEASLRIVMLDLIRHPWRH
jgi:hypothetical protein